MPSFTASRTSGSLTSFRLKKYKTPLLSPDGSNGGKQTVAVARPTTESRVRLLRLALTGNAADER